MPRSSRQIGWGQHENLLYNIECQLERLGQVLAKVGNGGNLGSPSGTISSRPIGQDQSSQLLYNISLELNRVISIASTLSISPTSTTSTTTIL